MDQEKPAQGSWLPPAPQPLAKAVPIAGLVQALMEEAKDLREDRHSPAPLAKVIPMAGLIQALIEEIKALKKGSLPRGPQSHTRH